MENKIYDIGIIGAGPAGMTAAIYVGRSGKSIVIFDKDGFGGQIAKSPAVENIPGFKSISGIDFATNMYEQMNSCCKDLNHIISEVKLINYDHGLYKIYTEDNELICCLSVIIATGSKHRELNFDTKDIYYCVTCDGPFFKKKNVVVVGSGNSGATYALELASYCKNVYLCDVTEKMCCEQTLQTRINETNNITWMPFTTISSVKNNKDGNLVSIKTNRGIEVKCSAIFAAIGLIPQTEFISNITKLNNDKYIIAPEHEAETLPGLFVAGDCRESSLKQVTTACSDGSISAIKAIKFVNNLSK